MKRLIAIVVSIVMTSVTIQAKDMQKYLRDTQALVRQGKHKEALERFLWFHDHALEHQASMYGVQLSFALSYWKKLGAAYPQALTAMQEVRDKKTDLFAQKRGTREIFHDVVALNRTLGDEDKTVELFRELDKDQSKMAKQCWHLAKDTVIKIKSYDLVRKYIDNPVHDWDQVKKNYERNKALYGTRISFGKHFQAYNENNFVENTLRMIEVSLALDDTSSAKEIQTKALAIKDDYRLQSALTKQDK
jgi:hypothetical protein